MQFRGIKPAFRRVTDLLDLYSEILRIRANDRAVFRMNRLRDEKPVFLAHALGHENRLGKTGAAVVKRSVGHFHSGQLGNVRLKLEDRLQRALRDLSLIGRVRRVELRTRNQGIDDDGDVVPVDAGSHERRIVDGIPGCSFAEIVDQFGLRQCLRNVQEAPEP